MRQLLILLTLITLATSIAVAAQPIEVKPASIMRLELGDSCDPAACIVDAQSQVKSISNKAIEAKVVDGVLNIAVPERVQAGRPFTITLQASNKKPAKLAFTVPERPLVQEDTGDTGGDYPDLTVTGLQPDGALTDQDLRFMIDDNHLSFDRADARAWIRLPGNDMRSMPYRIEGKSLIVSRAALDNVIGSAKSDYVEIHINVTDNSYMHIGNYLMNVYRPRADLQGWLLDGPIGDKPLASSRLWRLNLTGANDTIRRVIPIQPDGSFTTQSLPIGQYDLELVDLDYPGFTRGFFVVYPGDTKISGFLRYTVNNPAAGGQSFVGASFQGDGPHQDIPGR